MNETNLVPSLIYREAISIAFQSKYFGESERLITLARASLNLQKYGFESEAIAALFLDFEELAPKNWPIKIDTVLCLYKKADFENWDNPDCVNVVLAAIALETEQITLSQMRSVENCATLPENWVLDLKLIVGLQHSFT